MLYRLIVLILLVFLQCSLPGCASTPAETRPGFVPILFGSEVLWVEIAATNTAREHGLMGRVHLPEDDGMIFIYVSERILSFWMLNTLVDLDIAFVDSAGAIVDICQMRKLDETPVSPKRPAKYAIEANKGWFETRGIRTGDRVHMPPELLRIVADP